MFFGVNDFSDEFQQILEIIKVNTSPIMVERIDDILKELKQLDNQINESGLSYPERVLISRLNSIARYSAAYWVTEMNNPDSQWIRLSSQRGEGVTRRPPDWVYADISAAFIGAWFTANPFAALGGAAAGSAFNAFFDFP